MKKIQLLMVLLVTVLMGWSSSLRAEDTDIYVDNATNNGVPNVLFVIDTGANFSASAAPCTYASGGTPTLSGTAAGIEQCALVDAIESLGNDVVNIGILVNNNNNFGTDTRLTSDSAFHETCMGTYGGCVVRKLALMTAANRASLVNFIKSWKTSGSDSATEFNVKSGGDRTANTMQEAWAYYNGKIGMSGKNYATSILSSGCQKNFIIFIGNAFGVSGGPADGGSESPYSGTYGMTAAQTGATDAQKVKISEKVSFTPATCGVSSLNATTTASDWSENWADEWARLMYQQDGGAQNMENAQNIKTYTIGVIDPNNSCKPDYPALLTTMAKYGGGKYFKTSNSSELKLAVQTILNEVQAVNSVFSSASLPVSVNAEGSYLNQIYLGMFRPDATASPRWMGNLKQYHLIKNASGVLVMGDKENQPAISSSGTGFISPNAVSFWTSTDPNALPDSVGGFWVNDKKGVPISGLDLPDGEVVEKGGVAQQIRLESLTANYASTEGTSTNPRRLYTYCPAGTGCVSSLTDATNAFTTTNSNIAANAFGSSTTLPVISIVRSGSTATVTTSGAHGFSNSTVVTISNASQSEYNVTQTVTVTGANTFTISGLPDYPTTPSAGAYTVTSAATAPVTVTSMARTDTGGAVNTETVTVTTSAPHGFTTATTVAITGASPVAYNYVGNPTSVPSATTFTFDVAIAPHTPSVNVYTAQLSPTAYPALTGASLTNTNTGEITGSTSSAHKLHKGQTVVVSNASDGNNSKYLGTYTVATVISTTQFKLTGGSNNLKNQAGVTATVTPDTTPKTITLSRSVTTDSTVATATGLPSGWFGDQNGDTKIVNISKSSGAATDEGAYVLSNVTITCNSGCTQFTYPITVTPATTATGSITAGIAGAANAILAAGQITRTNNTATVTGVPASTFINGQTVTIAASGTALGSESGYLGSWVISCTDPCTTFTFGPVPLTPVTPATGNNITAYSSTTPPDKNTVIRWIRGEDNFGDEKGPANGVTVRPSVHGDVLHSRPLVVNYGDSRGIVVFYGSNDGIYRAINGNQTGNIGNIKPGQELWGLVLSEQYGQLNRQRLNTPELKFPSTTLPSAQPKNYFVDGPTAAYQKVNASGVIEKAYIYVTMRRGGRYLYALDVTQPAAPTVLWRISNATAGFEELGQTWSRPRATLLQGGGLGVDTPVLVFGGGYDPAEDSEPPTTDTMGRGIFIVNAFTGELIWQANSTCTSSSTCKQVSGMTYAIPSDVAFVDRDIDGYTDKLYVGDLGGNIWRVDVSNASKSAWTVTKLAALGCDTGTCASGTTPRKFFFPPAVLPILAAGAVGSFDAVSIPSGDREHPLKSNAAGSSYLVHDKFFMVNDTGTALGTPVTHDVTVATMFNATSTQYDGTLNGFYINFATGEKGVNAPLATNGQVFFATNRPVDKSATCKANLGEAKAYAVSPFLATTATNIIDGGGLPPSAVSGLITITNPDGSTEQEKFCIGCAADCTGSGCSALENSPPAGGVPKNLRRTYWYRK